MKIQLAAGRLAVVLGCILLVSCATSSVGPSATGQPPSINQVAPLTGTVGATVEIRGTNFAPSNNTVKFGAGYIRNLSSSDGTTLRFTVPDGLDLCAPGTVGQCPGAYPAVTPGEYVMAVMVGGQASNSVTFTVTR